MSSAKTDNSTVQHMVPEVLFQTERITDAEGFSSDYTGLVRKDTLLIRLIPAENQREVPPLVSLAEGENTYFTKDTPEILSAIDGYPLLTTSTKKKASQFLVSVTPFCKISADKMAAEMTLYPPILGEPELNFEIINEIFAENEIHFGFSEDHIQRLLSECKKSSSKLFRVPIARGLFPINGKDSFLRFAIEVGPLPGKILGNGKIN